MRVTTFDPPAALAPFVRNFTVVEAGAEATRLLVPDTAVALGVRFRGAAVMLDSEGTGMRLPDATFTGLRRTARRIKTSAGGGMVLAMFREGGVAPFFGEPLHEFFGETVGLDGLASRAEVERVGSQVVEARNHAGRVEAMARFLLARRAERRGPDPVVQAAVRAIRDGRGAVRVADVAASLGIGQDRLEKRFRRAVGASPKQFASIVRVRHAIGSHRPGMSLTRLAVEAGYADQSHFIREFKSVTGQTPGHFFRNEAAAEHC